jgi:HK97 family phage portal protein
MMGKILERRSESLARPGTFLYEWITGGGDTASGQTVNESKAMQLTVVYACINGIATDVATVPLHLYRRLDRGRERAKKHPLYKVLHLKPNPEHTSLYFRLLLTGHLLGWGNAYAQIIRDGRGYPAQLWPLHPGRMRVERKAGELRYLYNPTGGGAEKDWHREDVLHLKGLGEDGIIGYSPIRLAREAIGMGLAAQEYGARFYKNDARPSVVLKHPKKFQDKAAHDRVKKSWEESYGGSSNAFKPAILEEGLDIALIGIHPEDAEFIATRDFQVVEICRMYRMPPHKVQSLTHATYSNIWDLKDEYTTDTLRPWCTIWQTELLKQLFPENEWEEYYPEFLLDDLLRGKLPDRYSAYMTGRSWGWLSANDVRERENMNPIKGGDTYLRPLAYEAVEGRDGAAGRVTRFEEYDPEESERRWAVPIKRTNLRDLALIRFKTGESFRRIFEDAAGRMEKREAADVEKALKDLVRKGSTEEFNAWLETYYAEFPALAESFMSGAFYTYGEQIQARAAEEIGAPTGMTPGLEECLRTHIAATSKHHADISTGQVKDALERSALEGIDPAAGVSEVTEGWRVERAGQIAAWEITRTDGLMAKAVYFYAGVPEITWQEMDGNPSTTNPSASAAPAGIIFSSRRA